MGSSVAACSEWPLQQTCATSACTAEVVPCSQCREEPGSRFFDDDVVLLERLEAANYGRDRLLTKLHVNVALFSTAAADIVEGLLRLTRPRPSGGLSCSDGDLHKAFREQLQTRARPPVCVLKSLQWVYRFEELPEPAASSAQRCVCSFFSTTLAAAAALKWQSRPPEVWRRSGVLPQEVLVGTLARLSEVIASLRFLTCLALLQHFADPNLLSQRATVAALVRATGLQVLWALPEGEEFLQSDEQDVVHDTCSGAEAFAEAGRLRGGLAAEQYLHEYAHDAATSACDAEAEQAWQEFFVEARRRPMDAVVTLLRDLHVQCDTSALQCRAGIYQAAEIASPGPLQASGPQGPLGSSSSALDAPGAGPGVLRLPIAGLQPKQAASSAGGLACSLMPAVQVVTPKDTWDDEVIACPGQLEDRAVTFITADAASSVKKPRRLSVFSDSSAGPLSRQAPPPSVQPVWTREATFRSDLVLSNRSDEALATV
eukprot:TRINITY_DN123361_c0_g1_i1.p1 TRINITY_DN123361_c0_g1~~TRINITY_DN123361_c0_g1_i1.p1  ORF type:complete len:486 (+),score=117.57 TRINITY_DN123361_c0_g1_i1:96-1553(+)